METMNQLRAMDIMQSLWEIVRDNKLLLDELREDFDTRRRPCNAIRRMAKEAVGKLLVARDRFVRISDKYGCDESCALVVRTDKLYCLAVGHCAFFEI